MLEWSAATVEPGDAKPSPAEWQDVEVPGRPAAFAGEDRVAYRTTVPDPRDPDESMALLELSGVYDGGQVWLDDELVAEPDSVVDAVRVPFEPGDETELVVACDAPDDRFGGIHDTDQVPAADAVPGIWWDVDVTAHPEAFVVDVGAAPRLTDDGAAIDATVEVYADAGIDDRLTLTTRPAGERRGRGMMDRAAVEAAAGERATVEYTIELRDPSLWWPRGIGPQHRYEVRAKLDDAVGTATTGLATIDRTDNGFTVNGEPVPVRGVTLQDGRVDDVERAAAVNANLVRGHAHALPPAVYEACDEAGLLVWQDLPLTGPGSFDVDRGSALASQFLARYGGHPSLAALGVHDEPTRTFGDRVGSGFLDRLRFRWRVWRSDYDGGPAEDVAATVSDELPVVAVTGEPGSDPDAAALYPGWDYGTVADLDWVRERYDLGDVVGEFGAGSLAVADPEETAGFDADTHDAVVDGDGVEESQEYQADVVRSVAERLRIDGSPVVVANALRDTSEAGMGVFTRDGDRKIATDALATAFEPVRAFLADPTAGESDVVVVNDTPQNLSGTAAWQLGDESGETDVAVGAAGRAVVETVEVPADTAEATLTVSHADGSVTTEYSL